MSTFSKESLPTLAVVVASTAFATWALTSNISSEKRSASNDQEKNQTSSNNDTVKDKKVTKVTGDCIVVKEINGVDHVLLITRGKPGAFQGYKALPGGHVDPDEDPADAALRELEEECGVKGESAELICVKGKKGRDPRGHYVTCAYAVGVSKDAEVKAGDDAADADWYPLAEMLKSDQLAFDHKEILNEYVEKVNQGKK